MDTTYPRKPRSSGVLPTGRLRNNKVNGAPKIIPIGAIIPNTI